MYGIPLEQIKETPGYKYLFAFAIDEGRKEGREEGREEAIVELFSQLAAKRFPGLDLSEPLARVTNIAALEQLCLDLDQFADEAALHQRLEELTQSQE